jgi:hypothetical protein
MTYLREQNMPDEDLSDLGSPAPRGAGLAGLVAGPPPREPRHEASDHDGISVPDIPAAVPGSEVLDTGQTHEPPAPRTRQPGRPRTRAKPASAVYVSPGVKQRFEAYRHKHKATNLQVVLEAISSSHTELADIIGDARFNTAPVNPLFPADPSAVRYLGGGSVQIAFSPTAEQEQVINRIGAELGIPTRSTWIAPVLNAFLPGRKDTHPNR